MFRKLLGILLLAAMLLGCGEPLETPAPKKPNPLNAGTPYRYR